METRSEVSAGGVVYKKESGQVLWLLRWPSGNHQDFPGYARWSFAKGWIEKGETAEQAALREVAEEGGVRAEIVSKLSTVHYFYTNPEGQKVSKSVVYFLMEWLEDLKEGFGEETEEIKWVGRSEAEELLVYKNEKALLGKAAGKIRPGL